MKESFDRRVLPYAVAVGLTIIALVLSLLLQIYVTRTIGAFFYIAVIITAWYGGIKPGIVSTVLSVLAVDYFLIPPYQQFTLSSYEDTVRLSIFLMVALVINLFASDLRNSKRKVEQLSRQILQENAAQLRMALSAAQMGMWDWNMITGEISWSPEHAQLFGLAPGQFDGKYETFDRFIHPDDREELAQAVEQAIKNRHIYQHEYRVIWADGSIHWLEGRGQAFYDDDGKPVQMTGTIMNINRRKQAELALQQAKNKLEERVQERTAALTESNIRLQQELLRRQQAETELKQYIEKYEDLYNHAPCGYHSLDAEGYLALINDTALQWLGYDREKILGKPFLNLLTPEGARIFDENFPLFKQRGWINNLELQMVRQDGSLLSVSLNSTAIFDDAGNFVMSRSTIYDISDRKRMEEALRKSETQFRSLCEAAPIGVLMTNAQGKIIYTNRRAQEICGYSAKEALGDGWTNLIHPEDLQRLVPQLQADLAEQQGGTYNDIRYVHKDGTIRYGRLQTVPILSSKGQLQAYVGILEDITASRIVDQMKNEFISIVSHELRTPLTAIRGSLGLLANGVYDKKPEKGKQMLRLAATQTERLVRLVNDILDLGRLESGKVALTMQVCNADSLMTQAAEAMRDLARQNHITISVAPLKAQVWADPDAILQTFANLLSNAIKFSPSHSTIHLSAAWSQTAQPTSQPRVLPSPDCPYVCFAVKDQGRGIPQDKLEIIFGKFQQVDASDSRQKGGTGLGLAICQTIIQQHHGYIWVESSLGEGSTFYFTLPTAP